MDDSHLEEIVDGSVKGTLHHADGEGRGMVVLAHGAGTDRHAQILKAFAEAFSRSGFPVLRIDLPYRQKRPSGPPFPGSAREDQDGLAEAVRYMRSRFAGTAILGGHSYGGRQATLVAARETNIADLLLLLSYPLHPPRRPTEMRTAHWPSLRTPIVFVHGSRDPFGSIEEMQEAIAAIPAPIQLLIRPSSGHELSNGRFPIEQEVILPALDFLQRKDSSGNRETS